MRVKEDCEAVHMLEMLGVVDGLFSHFLLSLLVDLTLTDILDSAK